MKTYFITLATFLILTFISCEKKDSDIPDDKSSLIKQSEAHLFLKSGSTIYSDDEGNKYLSIYFDPETLHHIYSVLFVKDKKYRLSVSGNYCEPVDFLLLNSNRDTLAHGEQGDVGLTRKYIVWHSIITDTFFISVNYTDNINFHTYEYYLTLEEISTNRLYWRGLTLDCSGDWSINSDDYLTLACYSSSFSKWAKIVDDSLISFTLGYQIGLKSGIPDIYTGVAVFASDDIKEMVNLPEECYEFKIIGPATWEYWVWHGSISRTWGETPKNLNSGPGSWNELQIEKRNYGILVLLNNDTIKPPTSVWLRDNGLYLVVDDQKIDSVYFKDVELIK